MVVRYYNGKLKSKIKDKKGGKLWIFTMVWKRRARGADSLKTADPIGQEKKTVPQKGTEVQVQEEDGEIKKPCSRK